MCNISDSFYFQKHPEYTENKYNLEEIETGVYARYYKTISAIPAQNYEIIEICVSGNIYTYNGTVKIMYTTEKPYVVIMQNNYFSRCDKVYLYVPKDTIDYRDSIAIR